MTVRLYATRKRWPVTRIRTAGGHGHDPGAIQADRFTRRIELEGDLDDEQRARLLGSADRCPVQRTLAAGASIAMLASDVHPPAQRAIDHAVDNWALIAVGRGPFDVVQ